MTTPGPLFDDGRREYAPEVDAALIYDTVARDREAREPAEYGDVFAAARRRPSRPLVLEVGDRCPGCHVVCSSLDVEHLDRCFYQGRNAAILNVDGAA